MIKKERRLPFLMNDTERLRKFLVREHLFKMTIEIPGDIVELGVFKGIGIECILVFVRKSHRRSESGVACRTSGKSTRP